MFTDGTNARVAFKQQLELLSKYSIGCSSLCTTNRFLCSDILQGKKFASAKGSVNVFQMLCSELRIKKIKVNSSH